MSFPYELPFELPGEGVLDGATPTGGDGDGSLRPLIDECDSAFSRLLAQYQDSPLLKAWICSYVSRLQSTDNATVLVYQALDVDNATGYMLALLGRIVGELGAGLSVATFRNAIKTRILINRSQGRIPDLIGIAVLFDAIAAEAGAYVKITEVQPARMEVRIDRTPINPPHETDKRLRRAKAAGISLSTIVLAGDRTRAFRLIRAADAPQGNTTTGLGFTLDASIGGALAHVLS